MIDQSILGFAGVLAFFSTVGILIWLDYRSKVKQRAIDHVERMKSLEAGLPLADAEVARADADRARSRAAGIIGFAVPLVMCGGALAATLLLINHRYDEVIERLMLPLLCTIWGVCGLVSLVVPIVCASVLFRRGVDYPAMKPVARQAPAFARHN